MKGCAAGKKNLRESLDGYKKSIFTEDALFKNAELFIPVY